MVSTNESAKKTLIVIEDDPDIQELMEYNLTKEGFRVHSFADGDIGYREALKLKPDLIILDLMLPGIDGLSLCKKIKFGNSPLAEIPIIMLTAKSEESDIVVGLELGADDYITKPFSPRELIARIRAVLRRGVRSTQENLSEVVHVGPLSIYKDRHEVRWNQQVLPLTLAEYRILECLASAPGRVFSRDQLLDRITGGEAVVIDRNVDVHIRAIRKKLGEENDFIQTVRGVGYKCKDPLADESLLGSIDSPIDFPAIHT